jgi:hypothetical protein
MSLAEQLQPNLSSMNSAQAGERIPDMQVRQIEGKQLIKKEPLRAFGLSGVQNGHRDLEHCQFNANSDQLEWLSNIKYHERKNRRSFSTRNALIHWPAKIAGIFTPMAQDCQ